MEPLALGIIVPGDDPVASFDKVRALGLTTCQIMAPPKASPHWHAIARRWNQVGPPLRPATEDLAVHASVIERWASAHGAPRAPPQLPRFARFCQAAGRRALCRGDEARRDIRVSI